MKVGWINNILFESLKTLGRWPLNSEYKFISCTMNVLTLSIFFQITLIFCGRVDSPFFRFPAKRNICHDYLMSSYSSFEQHII